MTMRGSLRIGIDIDGVLADYVGAVRQAALDLGIHIDGSLSPSAFSMIEPGWFASKDDWKRAHTLVTGNLTGMNIIDTAAAGALAALRAQGHSIVILTARVAPPWQSEYDDADVREGTRAWLDHHGFEIDELHLAIDKTALSVDVLLDDAPHNIKAYQQAGRACVIYDATYNRYVPGPRATSISHFAQQVRGMPVRRRAAAA